MFQLFMPKKLPKEQFLRLLFYKISIGRELVAKSLASRQQNWNEKAKKNNFLVLIMQRENYVAHKLIWMTDEYYYMQSSFSTKIKINEKTLPNILRVYKLSWNIRMSFILIYTPKILLFVVIARCKGKQRIQAQEKPMDKQNWKLPELYFVQIIEQYCIRQKKRQNIQSVLDRKK